MLDLKEEQQYEQLRKLGQKLRIPIPEAFLELEVRDKDGRVIQRHKQRSHSWVRNAYNHMFSQLAGKDFDDTTFGAGKLSAKLLNGTVWYSSKALGWLGPYSVDGIDRGYRAAAASDLSSILVGSGTNAEDFEDYALQTQITEGAGAGQLNHMLSEAHAITYSDTTLKNELIRYFNNNSGGDVTVNEVALVGQYDYSVPTTYNCVVSRDKLASTVIVPDTGQLKVTYTVQLTYPS